MRQSHDLPTACLQEFSPDLKTGHTKICHFYMSVFVQQQVLWFEVSVAEREGVNTLRGFSYNFIYIHIIQNLILCLF